jgi:hypothetical protein
LVGLSLVAAISMVARPAAACSCPGSILWSPKSGATDVPLNPAIVIASWQTPVALFDTDQNVEVPTTVEPFAGLARVWLIRPNEVLSPNTTYGVGAGGRPGTGSFTTGTTTDHDPPGYVELTSFVAETGGPFPECDGLCMPPVGRRMKFDYSPPPADTSLLLLEVRWPLSCVAGTTVRRQLEVRSAARRFPHECYS